MLTKEKSRKIWKLKYLALMPLVFGMLLYTSCERQTQILDGGETILDYQKSTGQTKQKHTNGSRALAEWQWAQLMDKAVSNDFLSKEEFFRLKLLSHKVLSESRTVIKNGDTLVYMGSKEPFKKPTEEEYEYHIRNKKAFQILDYDLSVSIGDKMDVFQVDSHYPNLKGARVVEVADVKNMEGDDFRMFNKAMTETFEQSSNFGVVLLTDGFYHFSVIPRSVP